MPRSSKFYHDRKNHFVVKVADFQILFALQISSQYRRISKIIQCDKKIEGNGRKKLRFRHLFTVFLLEIIIAV